MGTQKMFKYFKIWIKKEGLRLEKIGNSLCFRSQKSLHFEKLEKDFDIFATSVTSLAPYQFQLLRGEQEMYMLA